ncbi:hypothetical protein CSAL01_03843 [Colletotrichum salicis]|uniref:Nephrocystin 3-like N-terminal domain-containing protein n=1 Tax=Colletotrichum salicis TaxID=1209931 RepID=A0A135UMV7_9PEZI|nr:hypothetical protein CSAL01_03843 [Colletotrichum salicis]
MWQSVRAEQGCYGCLDVLSSCFKQPSKTRFPSPDALNARLARAQSLKTMSGKSDVPLPTINAPEEASSAGLKPFNTSASPNENEFSLQTHEQPSQNVQSVSDLWEEAFQGDNPVKQLIGLVEGQEDRFKQHSAKITIGEREILWRDCATRVVSLLSATVDIGMQLAPTPGPVIWSALKVLLKAHTSGCESLAAIFGCADKVLCLMNRGAIYEQVFLQLTPADLDSCAEALRNALIHAYRNALELLNYARTQLREGEAVRRFFEALWDPQKAKDKLNELQEAERSLQQVVTAFDVKKKHFQNEKSLRLLQRLNNPLRYIDGKVTRILREMEDDKLLETLNFIFGAGESVLTSNIINRYLANENGQGRTEEADSNVDEGFVFFYYSKNNKDVADDPVTNILRSLLRQLARVPHHAERIFKDLASLCQDMDKAQRAFTPSLCRDKISTLVDALPRTIIVLDSLDELEPQHMQEIVSFFVDLVNTAEGPVKIFVSSRFTTDIYNEANKANNKPTRIDIAEQNQGDIESFFQARTERIDCRWRDQEVKSKVVEKISKDANGMFRWAFLQIDQLIKYDSIENVEKRLGQLPKDLTAAYDELYAEPGSHDEIYLQRAVKWVMHAHNPLSTEQLLSAIQLCIAEEHDDLVLDTRDHRLSEQTLESICRYLTVKDDQGKWAFPHASVEAYFVKKYIALADETARVEVAKLSLMVLVDFYQRTTAIESPDLGQVSQETAGDDGSIVPKPDSVDSLEYYVSRYWVSHTREIQGVPGGNKQISRLLKRFMISPDRP